MRRLELAGFRISPADRLRVQRALHAHGREYVERPEGLKYVLAPLLARSAAEQALFYDIFEKYYAEIRQAPDWQALHHETTVRDDGARVFRALLALALLTLGGWWLTRSGAAAPADRETPPAERHPTARLAPPAPLRLGDTLRYRNLAEADNDTAVFRYSWAWQDENGGARRGLDTGSYELSYPLDSVFSDTNKVLELTVTNRRTGAATVASAGPIAINCAALPAVSLDLSGNIRVGEPATFTAVTEPGGDYALRWDFGDGGAATGAAATHTYARNGDYVLRLTVGATDAAGRYCEKTVRETISIGDAQVLLKPHPLVRDEEQQVFYFSGWFWLLLGLLALPALWPLRRWWRLRNTPPTDRPQAPPPADPRFAGPDKAPYFIPFPNQDRTIRVAREQLRLADMLRLRQEGLRQEVDVPATLEATVGGGGFPALHYRYRTRPVDYLLLIDEQSANSHQARLFTYLAQQLREQDVHAEIFYFRRTLHRAWNREHPQGLTPELLHRRYGDHRLLVFGDGSGLLAPLAESTAVRAADAAALGRWRRRLLLTPRPPASWNYRERALARLFVVFPADLPGLAGAANFIEEGLEEEDLPATFDAWRDQQETLRADRLPPATTRSWADQAEYLADDPELLRWLGALAVYPAPSWELTLSIGEALGVAVTYDRLLRLSRLPWLQEGRLHPRLRREMLGQLAPENELTARRAVREQLRAAAADAAHSHANQELQTNLAIQDFAIDPEAEDHRAAIRYLLATGALDRAQRAELDLSLKRYWARTGRPGKAPDLTTYLRSAEAEKRLAEYRRKLRRRAALAAIALLAFAGIVFGALRMNRSDRLERWNETAAWMVAQSPPDSAVWYNNRAVEAYQRELQPMVVAERLNRDSLRRFDNLLSPAETWLERALALRPDYALARQNWRRLHFAAGIMRHHVFTATGDYESGLDAAFDSTRYRLRNALTGDSLFFDARHALGVVQYFTEGRDTAIGEYQTLMAASDSAYFDTLQLYPNLLTLLGDLSPTRILGLEVDEGGKTNDLAALEQALEQLVTKVADDYEQLIREHNRVINNEEFRNYSQPVLLETLAAYHAAIDSFTQAPDLPEGTENTLRQYLAGQRKLATLLSKAQVVAINQAARTEASEVSLAAEQVEKARYLTSLRALLTYLKYGERKIADNWNRLRDLLIEYEAARAREAGGLPLTARYYYNTDEYERLTLSVVAIAAGPAPDTLAVLREPARPGRREVQLALQAPAAGRTDSLLLQLIDAGGGIADTYSIPHRQEWRPAQAAAPPAGWSALLADRDTDQDGVPDRSDACPDRPGPAALYGCPDRDRDETPDFLDDCPDQYGPRAEAGCPPPSNVPRPAMVLIEDGAFQMGDVMGDGEYDNQTPVHPVTLDRFYLGAYEVTWAEYDLFCDSTGRNKRSDPGWGRDRRPAINVNWYDAALYCNWLSVQHGYRPVYAIDSTRTDPNNENSGNRIKWIVTPDWNADGYRLPTEAEWEYAARQRGDTVRFGNGRDIADPKEMNFNGSETYKRDYSVVGEYRGQTVPVGSFPPNRLGLYDMSGNVWEWCWDWYDANYYEQPGNARNPKGAIKGGVRVVRGGSWYNYPGGCRASVRFRYDPIDGDGDIGFRLARRP